jgi:hypothetical protein
VGHHDAWRWTGRPVGQIEPSAQNRAFSIYFDVAPHKTPQATRNPGEADSWSRPKTVEGRNQKPWNFALRFSTNARAASF